MKAWHVAKLRRRVNFVETDLWRVYRLAMQNRCIGSPAVPICFSDLGSNDHHTSDDVHDTGDDDDYHDSDVCGRFFTTAVLV